MKPVDPPGLDQDARLRGLLAALHLASPTLPVGGFAYSQGLESAIAEGLVADAAQAQRWIDDLLRLCLARFEAPLWLRAHDACREGDADRLRSLDAELLAARETAELRAESRQMAASLLRLFDALRLAAPPATPQTYPAAFAAACAAFGIDREAGLTAYLWSWVENQVLAGIKLVPLGQTAGQAMLLALHDRVHEAVRIATSLRDDELGSAAVAMAVVCARHETLYSRLYRS
jgi:urease accessory protein